MKLKSKEVNEIFNDLTESYCSEGKCALCKYGEGYFCNLRETLFLINRLVIKEEQK